MEVGNRADAARAGDYRLELEAAPEAYARSDYQLAKQGLERRSERPSSSLWLGADDALAQFGVQRGQAIEREQLIAVLQGQHVATGEQLRRPGALKREARDEHGQALVDNDGRRVVEKVTGVAHVEMTMSVPKSVSVLWAMADQRDRQRIEQALIAAAERTVQYMARNKAVVYRRGKDGVRVREPAAGAAVASSLHVTAGGRGAIGRRRRSCTSTIWWSAWCGPMGGWWRRIRGSGFATTPRWRAARCSALRSPTRSSALAGRSARAPAIGAATSRCRRAREPVRGDVAALAGGWEARTGGRAGAWRPASGRCAGGAGEGDPPGQGPRVWTPSGCGRCGMRSARSMTSAPARGSRLRRPERHLDGVEARMREARGVVLAQLREQGPTVSLARARALVFEAAAGRLSADEAAGCWRGWSAARGGELLALDGGRVTSREIRQLERHVIAVAARAAGRGGSCRERR